MPKSQPHEARVLDDHPQSYYPRSTLLNFSDQTGTGAFNMMVDNKQGNEKNTSFIRLIFVLNGIFVVYSASLSLSLFLIMIKKNIMFGNQMFVYKVLDGWHRVD